MIPGVPHDELGVVHPREDKQALVERLGERHVAQPVGRDLGGAAQPEGPAVQSLERGSCRGDMARVHVGQQRADVVERATNCGLTQSTNRAHGVQQRVDRAVAGRDRGPAAAPAHGVRPQSGGRVAKGVHKGRRARHGGETVHVVNTRTLERRVQLRPEVQPVDVAVQERPREPLVQGSEGTLEAGERPPALGSRLQDIVPSHSAAQGRFPEQAAKRPHQTL